MPTKLPSINSLLCQVFILLLAKLAETLIFINRRSLRTLISFQNFLLRTYHSHNALPCSVRRTKKINHGSPNRTNQRRAQRSNRVANQSSYRANRRNGPARSHACSIRTLPRPGQPRRPDRLFNQVRRESVDAIDEVIGHRL